MTNLVLLGLWEHSGEQEDEPEHMSFAAGFQSLTTYRFQDYSASVQSGPARLLALGAALLLVVR